MRIFKNACFVRFARDQKISDDALREAVQRADSGQIEDEIEQFKKMAGHVLNLSDKQLCTLIGKGQLEEVERQ